MNNCFQIISCSSIRVFVLLICFSLTGCGQTEKGVTSKELPDPYEAGWNGKKVCEILEENEELRVLKCTFPPGVGHEKHYHPPHVGYTLAGGRFRITDATGTRELNVPEGYTFSNDSITVHEVENIGESQAEFLIIEYK